MIKKENLKILYFILIFQICISFIEVKADNCNVGTNKFAVVELFTSEGCSDCPAADKNLVELSKLEFSKNVFPLAFHVTYWDYIGWKDPFGKPEFTDRQEKYSSKFRSGNYTPQAIVNGKFDLVGSRMNQILNSITSELSQASSAYISFSAIRKTNLIELQYNISCANPNQILNIALVEKDIKSNVTRGENRGKTLEHENVVRKFQSFDLIKPKGVTNIDFSNLDPKLKNFEIITFLQDKKTLAITAANRQKIN